ncbi:saccharopine dehydrogenase-like oxidoreductase [Neocloeon triangulifer]|uniref:saccharopine dehydrogenase-like oxidoreductase n=1 Tax=Neocloeon triangulifer TaxID=2078957 RepID=UPI00286F1ADD|nr:saccharopine dehydrogenase-like oxidoreductase [Neocloeon triangulifer]XP_059479915.1 saccharopine dehydrogenase-like oxidoreductase [Neocloeon triangulifer]
MADRLDIIIFGATGYTGKVGIEEIIPLAKEKGGLTWGIAGRNQKKLQDALDDVAKKTGVSLKDIPIIIANIDDEESMRNMTKQCKVLVNCVGPYRHWGEQAVKACIDSGTNHVDVSGEPQYMEKMQLLYNKKAQEKGIYIVSACGFDSIPAEIGSQFFSKQFEGEPNAVETYLTSSNKNRSKSAGIHYGTWESAVYGLGHANELRPLRQQLFPHRLPTMSPRLQSRGVVFRNPVGRGWCLPFLGSDLSVMRRSQYHFHEKKGLRPLQIQCYFTLPNLIAVMGVMFIASIFFVLAKFSLGRKLLLAYPKLFSCGFVSHEGPTEESRKSTKFSITFVGEGWTEKNNVDGNQHSSPPDTRVVTKVTGFDPGYGFTTRCLLLCAITIMKEADKMPATGGVYPPGAAFAETSLMSELQSHGLAMEVVEKKNIK